MEVDPGNNFTDANFNDSFTGLVERRDQLAKKIEIANNVLFNCWALGPLFKSTNNNLAIFTGAFDLLKESTAQAKFGAEFLRGASSL